MIPRIHAIWTSEQCSMIFVELVATYNGKWDYYLVIWNDGYVTEPINV